MDFAVGPQAAKAGYGVRFYDSLDSTNSEAMRLARDGERGPLWIVAGEQTAGRGRQGRAWHSLNGNLATSLLVTSTLNLAAAATQGFVAGLALHQACCVSAPDVSTTLKWPNDVLAANGKLAGLLLESQTIGDKLAVVIGFGVNLAAAPEGIDPPAISLAGLGHSIAPSLFFARLTDAFVKYDSLWDRGRGFADIRRLWLERAHGVGKSVSIHMGDRIERGIFETLDEQGCLILRRPDDTRCIVTAGDVLFGAARTAPVEATR